MKKSLKAIMYLITLTMVFSFLGTMTTTAVFAKEYKGTVKITPEDGGDRYKHMLYAPKNGFQKDRQPDAKGELLNSRYQAAPTLDGSGNTKHAPETMLSQNFFIAGSYTVGGEPLNSNNLSYFHYVDNDLYLHLAGTVARHRYFHHTYDNNIARISLILYEGDRKTKDSKILKTQTYDTTKTSFSNSTAQGQVPGRYPLTDKNGVRTGITQHIHDDRERAYNTKKGLNRKIWQYGLSHVYTGKVPENFRGQRNNKPINESRYFQGFWSGLPYFYNRHNEGNDFKVYNYYKDNNNKPLQVPCGLGIVGGRTLYNNLPGDDEAVCSYFYDYVGVKTDINISDFIGEHRYNPQGLTIEFKVVHEMTNENQGISVIVKDLDILRDIPLVRKTGNNVRILSERPKPFRNLRKEEKEITIPGKDEKEKIAYKWDDIDINGYFKGTNQTYRYTYSNLLLISSFNPRNNNVEVMENPNEYFPSVRHSADRDRVKLFYPNMGNNINVTPFYHAPNIPGIDMGVSIHQTHKSIASNSFVWDLKPGMVSNNNINKAPKITREAHYFYGQSHGYGLYMDPFKTKPETRKLEESIPVPYKEEEDPKYEYEHRELNYIGRGGRVASGRLLDTDKVRGKDIDLDGHIKTYARDDNSIPNAPDHLYTGRISTDGGRTIREHNPRTYDVKVQTKLNTKRMRIPVKYYHYEEVNGRRRPIYDANGKQVFHIKEEERDVKIRVLDHDRTEKMVWYYAPVSKTTREITQTRNINSESIYYHNFNTYLTKHAQDRFSDVDGSRIVYNYAPTWNEDSGIFAVRKIRTDIYTENKNDKRVLDVTNDSKFEYTYLNKNLDSMTAPDFTGNNSQNFTNPRVVPQVPINLRLPNDIKTKPMSLLDQKSEDEKDMNKWADGTALTNHIPAKMAIENNTKVILDVLFEVLDQINHFYEATITYNGNIFFADYTHSELGEFKHTEKSIYGHKKTNHKRIFYLNALYKGYNKYHSGEQSKTYQNRIGTEYYDMPGYVNSDLSEKEQQKEDIRFTYYEKLHNISSGYNDPLGTQQTIHIEPKIAYQNDLAEYEMPYVQSMLRSQHDGAFANKLTAGLNDTKYFVETYDKESQSVRDSLSAFDDNAKEYLNKLIAPEKRFNNNVRTPKTTGYKGVMNLIPMTYTDRNKRQVLMFGTEYAYGVGEETGLQSAVPRDLHPDYHKYIDDRINNSMGNLGTQLYTHRGVEDHNRQPGDLSHDFMLEGSAVNTVHKEDLNALRNGLGNEVDDKVITSSKTGSAYYIPLDTDKQKTYTNLIVIPTLGLNDVTLVIQDNISFDNYLYGTGQNTIYTPQREQVTKGKKLNRVDTTLTKEDKDRFGALNKSDLTVINKLRMAYRELLLKTLR